MKLFTPNYEAYGAIYLVEPHKVPEDTIEYKLLSLLRDCQKIKINIFRFEHLDQNSVGKLLTFTIYADGADINISTAFREEYSIFRIDASSIGFDYKIKYIDNIAVYNEFITIAYETCEKIIESLN